MIQHETLINRALYFLDNMNVHICEASTKKEIYFKNQKFKTIETSFDKKEQNFKSSEVKLNIKNSLLFKKRITCRNEEKLCENFLGNEEMKMENNFYIDKSLEI